MIYSYAYILFIIEGSRQVRPYIYICSEPLLNHIVMSERCPLLVPKRGQCDPTTCGEYFHIGYAQNGRKRINELCLFKKHPQDNSCTMTSNSGLFLTIVKSACTLQARGSVSEYKILTSDYDEYTLYIPCNIQGLIGPLFPGYALDSKVRLVHQSNVDIRVILYDKDYWRVVNEERTAGKTEPLSMEMWKRMRECGCEMMPSELENNRVVYEIPQKLSTLMIQVYLILRKHTMTVNVLLDDDDADDDDDNGYGKIPNEELQIVGEWMPLDLLCLYESDPLYNIHLQDAVNQELLHIQFILK